MDINNLYYGMLDEKRYAYVDPESGYIDDDEEMAETERELAEDAQWKIIQKNTFTRWVNEHIKKDGKTINDLQNDLSDGLRLISLVEVLSGHKFKGVNRRPHFRTQMLENVTMTLRFLEETEGLRLVNIDSSDIVDCRLKLILGLIWTLILHYSITLPTWEGEILSADKGQTPKQRLLSWLNSKMPEKPVHNFTTDWNDGIAIGALVDSCGPGLCPDWTEWQTNRALENTKEAMNAAEQWLEIPQLIKPEEMIDSHVDEKAMMTYLSQFPNAKLQSGAPVRNKSNPSRVRAYGPGLEPEGNSVGEPARFTVDTFSAGRGDIEINVVNPSGFKESCDILPNTDKKQTYSCEYRPTEEGEYRVSIKFSGKEINTSPFKVQVKGSSNPGNAQLVNASGPGLEPTGNNVGRRTFFNIFTMGAGQGNVDCVILDPHGRRDALKPRITKQTADNYLVEYTPKEEGLHSVNVFFSGQPIPTSPYGVMVGPNVIVASRHGTRAYRLMSAQGKLAYAQGRGIQPQGLRTQDQGDFNVFTEECGPGKLDVVVLRPDGKEEYCSVQESKPNVYDCCYSPQIVGLYTIDVKFANDPIQRSPFQVQVQPQLHSDIRAFGPGLIGGVVDKPAVFVVETNGETGALGFSIEGPSEAKIDCQDNGDGSASVTYFPTATGEYAVHILCDDEDIPLSPFMANIVPNNIPTYPEKVRAYGPGLESTVNVDRSTDFTVDVSNAGVPAPLKVDCYDKRGEKMPLVLHDLGDESFNCRYTPVLPNKCTVLVSYNSVSIPGSPFMVSVQEMSNPTKVRVYGPGLESVKKGQAAHFFVDCTEAGPGDIGISIVNEKGENVPIQTTEQPSASKESIFRIEYLPDSVGPFYMVQVYFADKEIPKSPFRVPVKTSYDINKIKVEGLESRLYKESFARFIVDAKAVDSTSSGTIKAVLVEPSHKRILCGVEPKNDGTYKCTFSPLNEGMHHVEVTYEGSHIKGSPFSVSVIPGCDPSRVKAYGPGLQGTGYSQESQKFTVDIDGAGQGGLGIAVEGPADANIHCHDNKDGTCSVEYFPTTPGTYDVIVKFNDVHVPGSPFHVPIYDKIDIEKVRCYGPGLESTGEIRKGQIAQFTVDARQTGDAPLQVTFYKENQPDTLKPGIIQRKSNRSKANIFDVFYEAETEGSYLISVKYGGEPVPGSPFRQEILTKANIKVNGEGVLPARGNIAASLHTHFSVDTRDIDAGDIEIAVIDPKGHSIPLDLDDHGDGTYDCFYLPEDVGIYNVKIRQGEIEIKESPFAVNVVQSGRADYCRIIDGAQDVIPLGQQHCITVDKNAAGKGSLIVHTNDSQNRPIENKLEENRDGTVAVLYTPMEQGRLTVDIKFGGVVIPNGHFIQTVASAESMANEEQLSKKINKKQYSVDRSSPRSASANNYNLIDFKLPVGPVFDNVKAQVQTPSQGIDEPRLLDNGDGTVTVYYQPTERGEHQLLLWYNDRLISGSPFKFFVEPINGSGMVNAFGPGLSTGVAGEPAYFTVITKDVGAGGLSLSIEGPSKAEIQCRDNNNGTCSVNYLPVLPGEYNISVKFLNQHITGSPFTARIAGDLTKRSQFTVASTNEVPVKIAETDLNSLSGAVVSPSHQELSCVLKRLDNGNLGISFTPREGGDHVVHVYRHGHAIPNSPFHIYVSPNEVGNANKVRCYGEGLKKGRTHECNKFSVDTREAGYGSLSVSIEGPSKVEIECHDQQDGTCLVTWRPLEPGVYIVNIRYADMSIPGSPFAVKVGGELSSSVGGRTSSTSSPFVNGQIRPIGHITTSSPRRHQSQASASSSQIGSQCELTLKITGAELHDLTAQVTSPSAYCYACEVSEIGNDHFSVRFVPREIGVHTVSVRHQGIHIPGSPFQFNVGPIVDGGSQNVHVSGSGISHGYIHIPNEFIISTRDAGAGGLSIAIEGPSKADIDFDDHKDGTCKVAYRVSEPGDYLCSLKFNDDHINGSPFHIKITGNHQQPQNQISSSFIQTSITNLNNNPNDYPNGGGGGSSNNTTDVDGYHIGRPASFTVTYTGANSNNSTKSENLHAFIRSPSGVEKAAVIQNNTSNETNQYTVRFLPTEIGLHEIHVINEQSKQEIVGSPFKIHIHSQDGDNKTMGVIANGQGLSRGFIDKINQFVVRTSNAHSGSLSVTIDGPSKVKLECQETEDCYVFTYTAAVAGEYSISIKYAGDSHIIGSPFRVFISEQGAGSYLSHYCDEVFEQFEQSTKFVVETSGTKRYPRNASSLSSQSGFATTATTATTAGASVGPCVVCQGPGLSQANIGQVNTFTVDASKAPNDVLYIGLAGPIRPCNEVNIKHLGSGQYSVTYIVQERGQHKLMVKWGEDHVPGSPFIIDVP